MQGVMTCLAGRLLVDTYVVSRELLKEVEYSLANLAGKFLKQQRLDLQPQQVHFPNFLYVRSNKSFYLLDQYIEQFMYLFLTTSVKEVEYLPASRCTSRNTAVHVSVLLECHCLRVGCNVTF